MTRTAAMRQMTSNRDEAQGVLDFDAHADTVILGAIDGREIELPRRDLVVAVGPDGRARGRYVLPGSALQPAPVCTTSPPPHASRLQRDTPPYGSGRR